MIMIFGKDNSLSKLLTIIYLDTFGHNGMQYLTDEVLIENPQFSTDELIGFRTSPSSISKVLS